METLTAAEWAEYTGRLGGTATAKKLTAAQRKESARRAAQARWAKADTTPTPPPQPTLRGRKLSASDKRRGNRYYVNLRPQLRLPLSIAATILFCFTLAFVAPAPLHASNSRFVVQGVSPKDSHCMPAKATLRRVVHRKPVPFMPHVSEPKYLLVYVVETLECGHRVTVYPQADPLIAQRRSCGECDGDKVVVIKAPKKPSASVSVFNLEKKRA